VWKLGNGKFERVKERAFEQASIAVDAQGKPRVAFVHRGKVFVDEKEVDAGERPSVAVGGDGAVHLAYVSGGKLVVRRSAGEAWGEAQELSAGIVSWPAMASGTDRPRVTFIGPAEQGPEALYLIRLAQGGAAMDPEPILVPSVAGNVTGVWLVLHFALKDERQRYRPHDVEITINGAKVAEFNKTVPDGRYVFPLKPYQVHTSSGRPIKNHVGIRSRHMNGGHYSVATDYTLITRTSWSERYAFAADAKEVAAAEVGRVNHSQPDLAVVANGLDLPVEPPKPGNLELPVTVMNLGEGRSKAAKLVLTGGETKLAEADVAELEPGASAQVRLNMAHDFTHSRVKLVLVGESDFDKSNDTLEIMLWEKPREAVATGAAGGARAVGTTEVAIATPAPQPLSLVRFLDAQSGKEAARMEDGKLRGTLPHGKYRLSVKRDPYEGQEVTFPRVYEYEAGKPLKIELKTTLELAAAKWAGEIHWWGAVSAEKPDAVVQWAYGKHNTILLPPGEYRFAIQPVAYKSQRLVFPEKLVVKENENMVVKADSGVSVPKFVAALPAPHVWGVYPLEGEKPVQHIEGAWSRILVPPGEYRWGAHEVAYRSPVVIFSEKFTVKAGEVAVPKSPGLVEIKPEKWAAIASFRLTRPKAEDRAAKTVTRLEETLRPMLVGPGKYDLYVHPVNYRTAEILFASGVTIEPEKTTSVSVASGIDVQASEESPPPDEIDFYVDGQAKPFQSWTGQKWGPQILPPGTYRVAFLPQSYVSGRLTWPTPVVVKENQLAKLTLESGVRITGPKDAKPKFQFQVLDDKRKVIQTGKDRFGVVWLPPGK
jgi:hypothetical protein